MNLLVAVNAMMMCGVLTVCCWADVPDPGSVYPQPAFTARQFVDFMGINASPYQRYLDKGRFKGAGTKYPPEVLFDLGIRHYRTALKAALTLEDAPQKTREAYAKYGIKPMMLLNSRMGTPRQIIQQLKDYGGSEVVGALEGPNEVNNKFPPQELNLKYGKQRDEAAGSLFMQDYFNAMKADPQTRNIPVVNFTAIFTDYRLAKPCDAFDYNNMHPYQGYGVPSSSLLKNFVRSNNILPVGSVIKPYMPTECGYNIEEDKSNQIKGNGSPHAQAVNLPMMLGEYFRHGFIKRAYFFALHNADGYGLLESDQQTKRPAYFAIQSLISQLKDATWNRQTKAWEGGKFMPRALLFTVEGAPSTLKSLTLQKQSGEYMLLMWNELPNWDSSAKRDIEHAPAQITLNFSAMEQANVQIMQQDQSGAFKLAKQTTVENSRLKLAVPSAVMIVRITPKQTLLPAKSCAVPEQMAVRATENTVDVSWRASKNASDIAGYFVYRNGWCIASLPAAQFRYRDQSPWIRPGLGYTYEVQAFDRMGNMSKRIAQIAQTAPNLPDLLITDYGLEKDVKPGQKVRFRATVKNIGDGATPIDVPISASFRIDGKVIAWFAVEGVLKPGEERQYLSGGGPKGSAYWTATQGTHVLTVVMDDINRIPGEKDKNNNFADKTLVVGTAPEGQITGNSEAAPFKVNLSSEGYEDWVHLGLENQISVNRKTGDALISDVKTIGKGHLGSTKGAAIRCSWNDGQPHTNMPATNSALWLNGVGNGYAFTAPADKHERVLKVYTSGINGADCSLTATLSDDSAKPYISKIWTGNSGHGSWAPIPGDFAAVYTIRYRAASDAQTLNVTFKMDAEANRFQGQARLSAITLAR